MTTLKERFYQREDFTKEATLAFFRQELLALAEEVEKEKAEVYQGLQDASVKAPDHRITHNNALSKAATLIRSKSDELV